MGFYRADVLGARVAFGDRHGVTLGGRFADLPVVPIRQVHGAAVVAQDVAGTTDADAVVLVTPGRVGRIRVADCAPVAIVGRGGAAAVHAGWRGLVAGVVQEAVQAMRDAGVEPVKALVGPCIHACCYEFGEEDLGVVEGRLGPGVRATTTAGSPALDLPAAVRAALAEAGVGDVWELGICTACSPDAFSWRRDRTEERQELLVTVLS